jgi:hypothetical protein
MADSELRFCEICSRLEKLERENRRLKTMGGLAALMVVSLFLMGQARSDRTLEAQRFVLKDASGNVGAELAMDRLGARLVLNAPNGYPVVSLTGSETPSLNLNGVAPSLDLTAGEKSIHLAASESTVTLGLYGSHSGRFGGIRVGLSVTSDVPALSLYDKNQRERILVEMNEKFGPSVILRDTQENENLRLGYDPFSAAPTLSIFDFGKKMAASLSLNKEGPNLELFDRQGYSAVVGNTGLVTPITGETHQTSAASLILFDKDKNVLWKAP